MLAYLNHIPSYPHLCIFNSAITNYPPFLVTHFHTPLLLSILFPLYRMAFPLIVYVVNFRKSFKTQFYEVFLPFIQNYLYFPLYIHIMFTCLSFLHLFILYFRHCNRGKAVHGSFWSPSQQQPILNAIT